MLSAIARPGSFTVTQFAGPLESTDFLSLEFSTSAQPTVRAVSSPPCFSTSCAGLHRVQVILTDDKLRLAEIQTSVGIYFNALLVGYYLVTGNYFHVEISFL